MGDFDAARSCEVSQIALFWGRGWHGSAVELEPALGCGNGSYMAPGLFPHQGSDLVAVRER